MHTKETCDHLDCRITTNRSFEMAVYLIVMFLILGIMSIGLLALCKRIEKLEEWRRLTSVDLMKVLDFLEKKDKKDRT